MGRYYHLKNHLRLCKYRPENIKKNNDCEVVNANGEKNVIDVDNDHRMGRKKVHLV